MNKEKLLSAISMARGAGKLKIGFDAAKSAAAAGAPIVLIASDISDRTRQAVERFCGDGCEIVRTELTQDDISDKFGWRFGVAAVTDNNFAKLINKAIQGRIK
ncbi:MAG: hypothetical protein IK029_00110 [Oscillospiraceae bacterium]|nr:hypothetical protein [Oscillospiraceae bacterium]MBR4928428.1 hypothetical protein [Oscillospiraceae bacterium]MBR5045612.1 hypothetical protein [Oscillospiraceae bacterium]MBR5979178.1 hypothetical protein [Oscillospiraceae bacterium]